MLHWYFEKKNKNKIHSRNNPTYESDHYVMLYNYFYEYQLNGLHGQSQTKLTEHVLIIKPLKKK